ncbi:EVE domain-containing protein [Legionella impletisoli]|uniref:EVE domain-containing protein n=1 Tax=Legionella impletisoli TaxID=343510 RepID=A0A917JWL2_9GAMM|nr:EVE domain-containing protein [Legionella impletisoli]GGI89982.1 EVE domain-containing protein [Legionella impletisoli]
MTQYWLMKSEPSCFSIDDLKASPNQTSPWDGVRNYQARNFMRDKMQIGDLVFFYHSNCNPPGIAGIAEIVSEAYPDYTAFDPNSDHPDVNSTPDNPRWFMVDVQFKEKFSELISLNELKTHPELQGMPLLRKGNRLSVMPVGQKEWDFIMQKLR